jgi:N-acyl-D-amino-acid deacylase
LGIPVNLGLLVPHDVLRRKVGELDKYDNVSQENIFRMKEIAEYLLGKGCLGISFGIRYVPGINKEELTVVCSALHGKEKIAAAHIRDDAKFVVPSALELINVGRELDIPVQVSHIGSMGAYGQMEELLSMIDYCRANGIDIGADCYPYNAFSTGICETTYDDGFIERYETTYESLEIAEGDYRGQRCSRDLFYKLREENPGTITIGHVMKENEVDLALAHPNVVVASDGFMHNLQGHPRASGTFPRVINKYVKEKKLLTLYEAIEKMTYLPAKRFGINKGMLGKGCDGDIVIFDYNSIEDKATFENPAKAPSGIKYVVINGEIAVRENNIINDRLGRSIRRF